MVLFPDYEYSSKIEKIPNERNRHKKNHIVKDLDYYKKYPGKDKSYVVAKVGEDILLQSQLDTLNGNRWLSSDVINYFLCYYSAIDQCTKSCPDLKKLHTIKSTC
uniref:Uncharacterized protein n=1 Tax=Cacopsylla melanoneura TaxID=428564 RepID=A0A8D8VUX4_9HEMI